MEEYVLDSYALLAYFQGEPGSELVRELLMKAAGEARLYLSLINLGEMIYITERHQGAETALRMLDDVHRLPIVVCGVDEERVLAAAHIKAQWPLSYADAFAAALAQEFDATVVTGDPEFRQVADLVSVQWL